MKRRVLYIHGINVIGGAERDLLAVLERLNREEWEPVVGCPAGGPLQGMLRQAGVAVHQLELPPWRKWFSRLARGQAVRHLRGLISHLSPSLLHVNDIWWVPHALQAVRRGLADRVPIVAHVRQEIEPEKVPRYSLDQVEAVIAISRQVEQALVRGGVEGRKVQTIYSGLALPARALSDSDRGEICRELGLPDDVVLLGTVANLFPRKGYHVMLRALPMIIKAVPAVHYLIIGTGEERYTRTLQLLAEDLGIVDHVHFIGFRDPVRPYLGALDLYVHPALMEGFGIAVLEAMAQGNAVVATSTGGLPEVVEQGETGLLVRPGDPDQLTQAVLTLLHDAARRTQMGISGAARVRERFNLASTVSMIERLYHDVLDAKPA